MYSRHALVAIVLVAAGICSVTSAAPHTANASTTAAVSAQATDTMTHYRTLAGDALKAFQAGDMATAKAKSRELEKAWDSEQKALRAKSPDIWKAIDDAMDAFIKPIMKEASPDAAKVQAAYDDFIAKLQTAVKP
jgi:hypothetical protein